MYTTDVPECQAIFVKNLYFFRMPDGRFCENRQGRFKNLKNTGFCAFFEPENHMLKSAEGAAAPTADFVRYDVFIPGS